MSSATSIVDKKNPLTQSSS